MGILSAMYGAGLSCARFLHRNPQRLPATVISIGNITMGGTGKTPAVIALASEARRRGHNPCILTRGYKGRSKGIAFVSRGDRPLLSAEEAGDEAFLMAETLSGIPVIKGSDRFRAGIAAFDNAQFAIVNLQYPTLFILDDGFQHWRLYRNMDIVLIDATNPFGNCRLFPEGRMREPFSSLDRAHIIVITKSDMANEGAVTEISRKVRQYNDHAPLFTSSHEPAGLLGSDGSHESTDYLKDRRVFAFSGIANPDYFRSVLTQGGALVEEFRTFRDHHIYSRNNIDGIINDAGSLDIITTEKDLVKIRGLKPGRNLMAMKINFSVTRNYYDIQYYPFLPALSL